MSEILMHKDGDQKIAEILSGSIVLENPRGILDIMANCGAKNIILHKENVHPDFFDLRTGFAGEVLQKLVNYQVRLAVVGDFRDIKSDSFQSLITESNRGNDVFFVEDVGEAKEVLFA
ncbi:MAG: DUF4180 domain-containing protein [Candidatus Uhrbacteria bacterium]|nr:DUF4180 domain-containing protein [Candidatus Uhrbacteria bacterium]